MANLMVVQLDLHQLGGVLQVLQLLSAARYGNATAENPEILFIKISCDVKMIDLLEKV